MRQRMSFLALGLLAAAIALHTDAGARTWYVAEDGTGDASDIPAAIDSSAAGDTILVGAGTYAVPRNTVVRAGTTMLSEYGATATLLEPDELESFAVIGVGDNASLIGFWIRGLTATMYAAVGANDGVTVSYNVVESSGIGTQIISGEIHHNLFIGPDHERGIYATDNAVDVSVHHNIILNDVDCSSGTFVAHCNDVLGDILCGLDSSSFSLDPQFCGVDNYFLQSDSPCAPGNHPSALPCGQIGPFPVGCGTVDTEEHSWGSVKSIYRE